MNYFTALADSPVYEFPYSGSQLQSVPYPSNDLDAILSSIAPGVTDIVPYQAPPLTCHCVPQINPSVGSNATVFQVSEDVPIETVLKQFGIDTSTLQTSGSLKNYYKSAGQPIDMTLYSNPHRRRRLVCHEVSDSEDDNFHRRLLSRPRHHRQRHQSGPSQPDASSPAIHNLMGKVWDRVRSSSNDLATSPSAPNLSWQPGPNRPPSPQPSGPNVNNVWQAMRNAPPPPSPQQRDAVSNVFNRAAGASAQNAGGLANIFNRMRQPSGGIVHSPPPMPNREAVHDFNAARNLPYGVNPSRPPSPPMPNREAVHDFNAARGLPYGVNPGRPPSPPNREAINNFLAARRLPMGMNQPLPPPMPYYPPPPPPPPPNQEAINNFLSARHVPLGMNQPPPSYPQNQGAVNNFFAARNIPAGVNQPPVQNQEAMKNFFAARHVPAGINQPNPALLNAWSRADYAAHQAPAPPPMGNPWSQMPPPQPNRSPGFVPFPRYGGALQGPNNIPAPASFASLLSQAHRQHMPYSGAT